MKCYIVEDIIGVLAIDDKGSIIEKVVYDRSRLDDIVQKLLLLEKGEVTEELQLLCEKLSSKGVKEIVLEDETLARNLAKLFPGLSISAETPSKGGLKYRSAKKNLLKNIGIDYEDYLSLLYEISVKLTKSKVKEEAEKRDLFIAQAISAIDETDKTINLYASRLREWYGLHFPELDEVIREHETYIKIIKEIGARADITKEKLAALGIPSGKAARIEKLAKESMGADITEFDLNAIQGLAGIALDLYNLRRKLAEYVDEAMKEVAPNIRALVGSLLGARLIALAGGLRKLAMLPASTIQVLGAEKALFRALRTGGKPPKHGVIFQYPDIFRSPRWQRGKIARALAAKLAIAARIDAFTGEYKADMLKEELRKRIEEIKTLYARPPPRKEEKPKRRRPPRRRRRRR
ncbi:MAG: C/D box methylation guide ribonucleoprotein complex aNOP56 subunit [Thermoprotei archaeon]|nr:MAG: C/D box methylation guide ribonucleoprotein complex aNOP56 subunit [Thermoprotei archaeon]